MHGPEFPLKYTLLAFGIFSPNLPCNENIWVNALFTQNFRMKYVGRLLGKDFP